MPSEACFAVAAVVLLAMFAFSAGTVVAAASEPSMLKTYPAVPFELDCAFQLAPQFLFS